MAGPQWTRRGGWLRLVPLTLRLPHGGNPIALCGWGLPKLPYSQSAVTSLSLKEPSLLDPNTVCPVGWHRALCPPSESHHLPAPPLRSVLPSLLPSCAFSV